MTTAVPAPRARVSALDALRGLIMVIMALDHVRDYFHAAALEFQPDDLSRTTAVIFFTRWVTHFCAPVFMMSAGMAAYLRLQKSGSLANLSGYLWRRGLFLVILEPTAVRLVFNFNLIEGPVVLTILWALGWSMIALSLLIRIPIRWLAPLSIGAIALHNLADSVSAASFGGYAWVWNFLHQVGLFKVGPVPVVIGYPIIPWIFVMALGFCLGPILLKEPAQRERWLLRAGMAATIGFVLLRWLNVYGDPRPWSGTLLSFLRVNKYPPSLDFLLMTLGPALILLALFYRMQIRETNPIAIIGRVPLFYFFGHVIMLHLLAMVVAQFVYGRFLFLFAPLPFGNPASNYPPHYGYSLGASYAAWIAVVLLMYPLCVWYDRFKRRNRWPVLSYL